MTSLFRNIVLITALLTVPGFSLIQAQGITMAQGIVRDSVSGKILPYASVAFANSSIGTLTDDKGRFDIRAGSGFYSLTISMLGYEAKTVRLKTGLPNEDLEILLCPIMFNLETVEVRPDHERYSRRNNPAVELIRKVIEHKNENRIESKDQYKVEMYEKLSLSIDYFADKIEKNALLKNFSFAKIYTDTTTFKGKSVLTLSIREAVSDYYYRKKPETERTITKARQHWGIDQTLDVNGTFSYNLDEMFNRVNIFDNDISILLNKFVSPLSSTLATAYYKYYILDTLDIGGEKCVNLAYVPFNTQSYGFTGQLYVTLDGKYSVKKASLITPRNINLNWVGQLRIEQEFVLDPGNDIRAKSREDIYVNFYPMENLPQVYAHRLRSFGKYDFAPVEADSVFRLSGTTRELPRATKQPDTFWTGNRPIPLPDNEDSLSGLMAEFKKRAFYNIAMKTMEILTSDYVPVTGDSRKSPFDIGPLSSSYGSNYVEGSRFRIGGSTTANLHPQWFANAYLAYGLKDRKLKYQALLTYSFIPKKYHENESPVNNLSFRHGSDVYTPGQTAFSSNLFIKTGKAEMKMQYLRQTELQYEKEWANHFSVKVRAKYEENRPAGGLQYRRYEADGSLRDVFRMNISELGIHLRFAPKEKDFNSREGKSSVFNFSKDAPVFRLSHQTALKDVFGSGYAYNHTEASAEKRIWLSSFGCIDASLKTGKVWNKAPFPLLILPNTSQSIIIEKESFMMMQAMEFVSDEYASLFLTYYLKGWILNRIPLIQKLKLRETLSLGGMYGKLSDGNNPAVNPEGLFQLPEETRLFENKPYLEASIGIENIFKVLRIDYFRRLTYLDAPGVKKNGVRIAFRFAF